MSEELTATKEEPEEWGKSCIGKVLRGKHCLVIGATGSGKTYWMAKVARDYLHRFIFVNPNMEPVVEEACTSHYNEASEVLEGITNKELRIEFIPDVDTKIALEQLKELREGLFEMAEDTDIVSGTWWCNVIIDEAQSWAWKASRGDVEVFATRGRRFGIRTWFITQRPQNVSSTIINNVDNQIVFLTGLYEIPYFKNYQIPIEEQMDWLSKKYHYVLYDGRQMFRCLPAGTEGAEISKKIGVRDGDQEMSLQEREKQEESLERIRRSIPPPQKRGILDWLWDWFG